MVNMVIKISVDSNPFRIYMFNYLHYLSPLVMYSSSPLGRKVKEVSRSKLPKLNKKVPKGNKIYSFIALIR